MAGTVAPPPQLRYPLKNIGINDDYLKIEVVEYVPPGLSGQSGNRSFALGTTEQALSRNKNIRSTIILPIPQSIQDSNSANWGPNSLNSLAGAGVAGVEQAIKSSSLISGASGSIMQIFSKFNEGVTEGTGQQAASAAFSGMAVQALLGQGAPDFNALISRSSGAVVNQNVELLFNGVDLRQPFTFVYDIVPRSEQESLIVKNIIRTFKQEMTPRKGTTGETGSGFFVKSPNIFILEYMSGGRPHPFLHKFKPCALTNMSVNYTGSGTYATYSDATPVHMNLSLAFQELSVVYAEDYTDNEKGREGVGY